MGSVLVVHPPVTVARDWIDYPYFADLGAVQLTAELEREHTVRLVDAYALPGSTLYWRRDGRGHLGASVDEVLGALEPLDAELVIVTVTPFHRPPHRDDVLAAVLRGIRGMTGAPIVLADAYQSGQHYVECDTLLDAYPEADAWVKYEAELTVPALARAFFERGVRPRGLHRGESPPELDALAAPAWHAVDLDAHDAFRARLVARSGRAAWQFPIDGRTLPAITSRGCPFRCAHCSSNPGLEPGAPKTQRRLNDVAARFAALAGVHGATRVAVLDELVNVNAGHFERVLDAVEANELRLEVPNGFRADYLSRAHLDRMRGRVTTVSVSAESGSQRVLDTIVGKQLDLADIERVAADAQDLGLALLVHWMIGLPGEAMPDVNRTLERALELYDRFGAWPAVQFATPLPGTALARGRTLPVVDDWGPCFQTAPTQPGAIDAGTLRRARDTFEQRLAASRGPEKLIMNVTYACNNHCTFCAVGTRTQVDGNFERQREYLDLYRARGVTMVDFDGGEPTLDPMLIDLVRHARRIGYERVNVTTNGRRAAYAPFAKALARSGLTTLLFSVHGPDAKTHAQQVGVAEAFEQTLAGIENCRAHAPRSVELGMNVTITKGNADKLEAITALAAELGLRWINLQFLTPFGRATSWVAPDTEAAAKNVMRLIDRWKSRMKIQVINLPYCFMPGYEAHLAGDLAKLARHMIFVNNEAVNLAAYLAERRVRKPVCEACPHACFCGGFYELDDVPEPPWLIAPEDLVRPVRAI